MIEDYIVTLGQQPISEKTKQKNKTAQGNI